MGIQAKICRRLVNDENRCGVLERNSSPGVLLVMNLALRERCNNESESDVIMITTLQHIIIMYNNSHISFVMV